MRSVRSTTLMSGLLGAMAATIATIGFLDAARLNDAPTAAECAQDWNAHAGADLQARVAAEGYRSASVIPWFHDWAGCGIGFATVPASLTCTRALDPSDPAYDHDAEWHCEPDFVQPGSAAARSTSIVSVFEDGTLAAPLAPPR